MSQYQQNYPNQGPGYGFAGQSQNSAEGQKHAQLSLVFGIIGLFALGVVFGPLAIVQAGKAEKLHQPATAGKVLGWISTIFGILGLIFLVLMIAGIGMMGSTSTY